MNEPAEYEAWGVEVCRALWQQAGCEMFMCSWKATYNESLSDPTQDALRFRHTKVEPDGYRHNYTIMTGGARSLVLLTAPHVAGYLLHRFVAQLDQCHMATCPEARGHL